MGSAGCVVHVEVYGESVGGCNLIATKQGRHGRYELLYVKHCGVSSAECLVNVYLCHLACVNRVICI